MKKLLSIILAITLMLSMTCNAIASSNDFIILSELSDQECLSFLKANGLTIPNIYSEEEQCIPLMRMVVNEIEANPNVDFTFNYHVLEDFANEIKAIVIDYYSSFSLPSTYAWSYSNILQENTVYGSWTSNYANYRCYSYVMGYEDYMQPGQIEWTLLGNERTDYVYNYFSANLETIVGLVKDDLTKLGYSYSEPTTTMPQTNISQHTHLICVRKDYDTTGDYHFMKLGADGYWYHKPGPTNPLRYNSVPVHDAPWTREGYDGSTGRYYRFADVTYESEIYFIEYTTPHIWNYESAGFNNHTLSCTICNYTQQVNCNYSYTYIGNNMHNGNCVDCGGSNITGAICSLIATYNNNGTHTLSCSYCSNTRTESCNLEYTNITDTRHSVECTQCDYAISSEACTLTYTSNGDKTHTIACTGCGNSFTADCGFVSTYSASDQHYSECSQCGAEYLEDCDPVSTYCGNATIGNVHTDICADCGHQSGTATQACTFTYKSYGNNTHVRECTQCRHVDGIPMSCVYKADNTCRFCGALKGSAVINKNEEDFSEN